MAEKKVSTPKVTTQVYQLPDDQAQRERFLEGIRELAAQTGAQWLAGSAHNEMEYVEALEKELGDELGDLVVEDFRLSFERKARAPSEA
ncbi:MAG: hypothetical protein ITG07_02120 [Candidimonas sp.]|nr:hypothetical protein [Candidimonas sp.]